MNTKLAKVKIEYKRISQRLWYKYFMIFYVLTPLFGQATV